MLLPGAMAVGYERAYARVLAETGHGIDLPLGDLTTIAERTLAAS